MSQQLVQQAIDHFALVQLILGEYSVPDISNIILAPITEDYLNTCTSFYGALDYFNIFGDEYFAGPFIWFRKLRPVTYDSRILRVLKDYCLYSSVDLKTRYAITDSLSPQRYKGSISHFSRSRLEKELVTLAKACVLAANPSVKSRLQELRQVIAECL